MAIPSARPGQAQDRVDYGRGGACDDLIEYVGADAHLRSDGRQKEQRPNHDPDAVRLEPGKRISEGVWRLE